MTVTVTGMWGCLASAVWSSAAWSSRHAPGGRGVQAPGWNDVLGEVFVTVGSEVQMGGGERAARLAEVARRQPANEVGQRRRNDDDVGAGPVLAQTGQLPLATDKRSAGGQPQRPGNRKGRSSRLP